MARKTTAAVLRERARLMEHGAEFNEDETQNWPQWRKAANTRLISQSRELYDLADAEERAAQVRPAEDGMIAMGAYWQPEG